jgi:hypothetical protein
MGEGMWVALALQTFLSHLFKNQKLVIPICIQNMWPFFTHRLVPALFWAELNEMKILNYNKQNKRVLKDTILS